MFKIEKKVPMPQRHERTDWPFADMNIGDSFLIPLNGESPQIVGNRASQAARAKGIHVSYRSLPDGVRVWRVE